MKIRMSYQYSPSNAFTWEITGQVNFTCLFLTRDTASGGSPVVEVHKYRVITD